MNKRGVTERQFLWTFYLVFNAVLFLLLYNYFTAEIDGSGFYRAYQSRDLSLMVASVAASPGELQVNTTFTVPITFTFTPTTITARGSDGIDTRSYSLLIHQSLEEKSVDTNGKVLVLSSGEEGLHIGTRTI